MTKIEEFAQAFTAAVQNAFVKAYGKPSRKEDIDSIRPSWSLVSVRQGWVDPDPRVVVVGTEYAWVQDPYNSQRDMKLWEKAMELLAPWGNVHFESINAAIHIVYIDVPTEWSAILTKRAMERSR